MSERKTTEIKLRVAPEEKTSWQLAAERREVGLSQFIRDSVHTAVWADQNRRMDSTSLVDNAIATLRAVSDERVPTDFAVLVNLSEAQTSDTRVEDSSVEQAVPTSSEADLVGGASKPWMFRARAGD